MIFFFVIDKERPNKPEYLLPSRFHSIIYKHFKVLLLYRLLSCQKTLENAVKGFITLNLAAITTKPFYLTLVLLVNNLNACLCQAFHALSNV